MDEARAYGWKRVNCLANEPAHRLAGGQFVGFSMIMFAKLIGIGEDLLQSYSVFARLVALYSQYRHEVRPLYVISSGKEKSTWHF